MLQSWIEYIPGLYALIGRASRHDLSEGGNVMQCNASVNGAEIEKEGILGALALHPLVRIDTAKYIKAGEVGQVDL